jgi:hypothetical protein
MLHFEEFCDSNYPGEHKEFDQKHGIKKIPKDKKGGKIKDLPVSKIKKYIEDKFHPIPNPE